MEKVVREKLWTHSFCAVAAGNFLLFFAFYLLLPVLPMYLSEAFAASRSTAGFILSSYTITALMIRPFAGYMVDTFPRKKLLLICYFTFLLFFGGYLLAGTLLLFAIIRAGHGIAFGLLTVSNSTVAIDVMPSSRSKQQFGYGRRAYVVALYSRFFCQFRLYIFAFDGFCHDRADMRFDYSNALSPRADT